MPESNVSRVFVQPDTSFIRQSLVIRTYDLSRARDVQALETLINNYAGQRVYLTIESIPRDE